jgi:hypothetical protein
MLIDDIEYIDASNMHVGQNGLSGPGKWSGKSSVAPPGNMSDHCQDYSRINHVRGRERIPCTSLLFFAVITYCTSKGQNL